MQPQVYDPYGDYRQYATQFGSGMEVIGWSLWDTQLYTSTATLAITFFTTAPAGRSLDLSNMEIAGQLAAPQQFLIRALRFMVKQLPESVNAVAATNPQPGALDNVAQLMNTGWLQLTIGTKTYGPWPLWKLTTGGGAFGAFNVSNILIGGGYADSGTAGWPDVRNVYTLSKPLLIPPQMNFRADLQWPAALTLTRNENLLVALEGDLIRQIQ